MSTRYVRLTPYDPRVGAKCRRYMIGGCLFKENQWYELDGAWAAKLEPLIQGTGARVFQILSAEEYGETVRAELAAAYMRGGVSLAVAGAMSAPAPGAPPKKGARKSAFDGMDAAEADLGAAATGMVTTATLPAAPPKAAPAPPPEPEPDPEPEADDPPDDDDGEEIDLATIRTHKQADALAEKYGVDLDGATTVAAKRDRLAEELFTAGDDEG